VISNLRIPAAYLYTRGTDESIAVALYFNPIKFPKRRVLLEYQIMGKAQNLSNPQTSEPFSNDNDTELFMQSVT
jgi:hypothetical protein